MQQQWSNCFFVLQATKGCLTNKPTTNNDNNKNNNNTNSQQHQQQWLVHCCCQCRGRRCCGRRLFELPWLVSRFMRFVAVPSCAYVQQGQQRQQQQQQQQRQHQQQQQRQHCLLPDILFAEVVTGAKLRRAKNSRRLKG